MYCTVYQHNNLHQTTLCKFFYMSRQHNALFGINIKIGSWKENQMTVLFLCSHNNSMVIRNTVCKTKFAAIWNIDSSNNHKKRTYCTVLKRYFRIRSTVSPWPESFLSSVEKSLYFWSMVYTRKLVVLYKNTL